jgi:pimeloyl-ACP methyl ester carboxylesterase
LSLSRWLGPWANDARPRGIERRAVPYPAAGGRGRAYVFHPRGRPSGTYLVLPGLHFLGPDDPRFDKFARSLAASGLLVVAPFIGAFTRLRLDVSMFADAEAALDLAERLSAEHGLGAPAVFSISFGSTLAFHLGARRRPRRLVVFGGFHDFVRTVRFAVTGTIEHRGRSLACARDPLNAPVVFLNLLEELALDERGGSDGRDQLAAAWLEMVHRTWGKMELKRAGARDPIAHAIARSLPSELRTAFLRGCTLEDGALAWLEPALERGQASLGFVDPAASLRAVRCPVVLVHGRDDDVIPYTESVELFDALPREARRALHLTGAFGHTGAASLGLATGAAEARTMLAMVRDLASAPHD